MSMVYQHQELASGKWKTLSFFEQMANVGSEVERSILWKEKNNLDYSKMAFNRALELLDLTIADNKNKSKLKELCRLREILVDYFIFDNEYKSSDQLWRNYFYPFNWTVRVNH